MFNFKANEWRRAHQYHMQEKDPSNIGKAYIDSRKGTVYTVTRYHGIVNEPIPRWPSGMFKAIGTGGRGFEVRTPGRD